MVCIWVHICMCTRLYNEVVPMCLVSDTDYTLRLLNIRIRFPPEKIAVLVSVPFSGAVGLFNKLQTQKK